MYLTPTSMTYLTQLILGIAIAGYFIYLARRIRRSGQYALPTMLMAGAFTSFTYALLLLFLNVSLPPSQSFYVMPLESVAVALFVLLLLQFAYRFPALPPEWKREARVALGLTVLYVFWEALVAGARYNALRQGRVQFRPEEADVFLFASILWVTVVFLRQSIHSSAAGQQAGLLQKLWRPQGSAARAASALAGVTVMIMAIALVEVFHAYALLEGNIYNLYQSFGILFALFAFALVTLNYLPEKTSFMVKLVGITMAVALAILGSVGWIITPAYVAAYHNDRSLAGQRTLRFTPNAQGGYDVTEAKFHFDSDLGQPLDGEGQLLDLAFAFPFYDQTWRQVFILEEGIISLGQKFNRKDARYRYGPTPAIIPLYLDLDFLPARQAAHQGLFVKTAADRVTATWSNLSQKGYPGRRYTFQVALHASGVFEITYNDLPPDQPFNGQDMSDTSRFMGVVPGAIGVQADRIHFMTDLPTLGRGRGGLVEDAYLDFRRYLHRLFLPLARLVLVSSILIVFIIPVFFRRNLLRPLQRLLEGMRQMDSGNLDVNMPVQFHDEIGFLTQSFNAMAAELRDRTAALHARTDDLETLVGVSSALRQATMVQDIVALLVDEMEKGAEILSGSIFLLEDGELMLAGSYGIAETVAVRCLHWQDIPCWPQLKRGELVHSDLAGRQVCAGCGLCEAQAGIGKTLVAIPFQSADQILGLLLIAFGGSHRRLEEAISSWVTIVEMGGNALERARTMQMLEQLVQDRTRELTALYEVTTITTQSLDFQTMLERVLDKTLETIEGEFAIIHLANEADMILRRRDRQSDASAGFRLLTEQTHLDNLGSQVIERQAPIILEPQALAAALAMPLPGEPLTWIGLPIQTGGKISGVLNLFATPEHDFSVEDIVLLTSIAGHIGMAVESAQLRRQAREAAVQEERRRLGRDLHDSVTQSLHSLTLSADTAHYLLTQGRPAPLGDVLLRLREGARQALKEMRLLLYELRLTPLPEMDLVARLQTRLEAVEQHAGIETHLIVDGAADWPREWGGDLCAIAIEALNNALQHARASQVSVHLRGGGDWAVLEVIDDGRGFDPQQRSTGGMGLQTMAERARRLGASLTVDSAPGKGTCVRLSIGRKTEKGGSHD